MIQARYLMGPVIAAALLQQTSAAEPAERPVVMGVCTAGSYHHMHHHVEPWESDAFWNALKDLGAGQVNLHLIPVSHLGERNSEVMEERMAALDAAARAQGMRYTLDLETPNFISTLEITPGVNEYAHSDDRHFWLLRRAWIDQLLATRTDTAGLQSIVYDEAAHMQLSNNKYSNFPTDDSDKPFFVNTHGMPIEEAYQRLVDECRRIRIEHYGGGFQLNTEQVWPDLFHIFARAGWTAAPKFLKEHLTPVVASIALSAAVQYQDDGCRFWVSPDLWGVKGYPGHSPEALRSALLMGCWLGAECIYVENVDYPGMPEGAVTAGPANRHPEAEAGGSLLIWEDAETYRLSPHGKVYKAFTHDYLPAHPRTINWRTYLPRVAIVRLPDGGWGQYDAGDTPFPHPEAPSRNRLLGNREMPLDEAASEWLHVWPILTHGVAKPGAISYNNPMVYPEQMDFFVPVDSVGVFDHLVTGPVLDSVECFIVCGHALSRETFEDIRRRVEADDATCIIARRLFDRHAREEDLSGDWLVVDAFTDPAIAEKLRPFLGSADEARFRFADQTVVFKKGAKPDSVEAKVISAG